MNYTILQIDSSPAGDRSVSRKLVARTVQALREKHPDNRVLVRDLVANPLPHLDSLTVAAFFTPPDQRSDQLSAVAKLSDAAVTELLDADTIVIGAPMHNFGIPSGLKSWVDHIVRAGKTFKYGPSGPIGLVPPGKKVIIVSSRGGVFSQAPMDAMDFQEAYLRTVLGFIGFHDISVVRAEGVAMGPDAAAAAMRDAEHHITSALSHAA